MTERRTYTKRQKANAVGLALVNGTMKTAETLGIPAPTVSTWRHSPEFAGLVEELRSKTRESVADEVWSAFQLGVREVAKGLTGEAPLRDKAMAAGVLYDKYALLTGSATSRTESRDLTGTLSDSDIIAAVREAVEVTTAGGVAEAPEGTPEG